MDRDREEDRKRVRSTLLLAMLLLSSCGISSPAPATPTLGPTHLRSNVNHLEVDLPAGWAASEGPELLARPFSGLVAFNSWGQAGFWARQVVLLFGGSRPEGDEVRFLSDTLAWDGQTWTEGTSGQLSNGDIPQPSLVYDAAHEQVVLWQYGTGTWTWDGRAWTHQQLAGSPDLFIDGVLGYNEAQGQVIFWHDAHDDEASPET